MKTAEENDRLGRQFMSVVETKWVLLRITVREYEECEINHIFACQTFISSGYPSRNRRWHAFHYRKVDVGLVKEGSNTAVKASDWWKSSRKILIERIANVNWVFFSTYIRLPLGIGDGGLRCSNDCWRRSSPERIIICISSKVHQQHCSKQ